MSTENTIDPAVQHTLRASIHCVGIGVHSGARVSMRVRGARPDSGIGFVRKDAPVGKGVIPALWDRVTDTRQCTVITNEHGVSVRSIEHLLAAFYACGIDNAIIEVEGPEVPATDGSAQPFVSLIERAGITRQGAVRRLLKITKPLTACEGNRFALLMPADDPAITVEIEFANRAIGFQRFSTRLHGETIKREVAAARTFGFMEQVDALRNRGLALGGSLQNAIALEGDQVLNAEGLRFADEFVRHKALDCIGDLALAGVPIIGHVFAHKPGHGLNLALLRQLFAQADASHYVTLGELYPIPTWRRAAEQKLTSAVQRARSWLQNVA